MNSAAGVPSSCCFMTATICSVENRLRFVACALLKGFIMPETNLQSGSGIAKPLIFLFYSPRAHSGRKGTVPGRSSAACTVCSNRPLSRLSVPFRTR